jgi:hypothetical protein
MFDAIKLGCGFQLGRALCGLAFLATLGVVIGGVYVVCAVLDWRNRRRRAKKAKG